MTSSGLSDLVFYEGRVNGQTYIQLIGNTLIRYIKQTFGVNDRFLFMQDNAPAHTSKYAMNFFKKNKIPVMKWPASSLDLNVIENMWNIIDEPLKNMRSKNLKDLQSMIQQIWTNIDHDTCKRLVDSMPRRLKSCQLAKGGTMSKY